MAMSKRDFEMIAAVVREEGGDQRAALAERFASELAGTNPRFDRARFVDACTNDDYRRRA